jgi:hypothetical protein
MKKLIIKIALWIIEGFEKKVESNTGKEVIQAIKAYLQHWNDAE